MKTIPERPQRGPLEVLQQEQEEEGTLGEDDTNIPR
jgi:hypothetical protein